LKEIKLIETDITDKDYLRILELLSIYNLDKIKEKKVLNKQRFLLKFLLNLEKNRVYL